MRLEAFKKVLLVHVPQGATKLKAVKLFSSMFTKQKQMLQVCQPVALPPPAANRQTVPFWKPPISLCLEPGGHGDGRTFRAQKP